jgi:protein-arginine kinase activator protein McsA
MKMSPSPNDKLCEKCHERKATVHSNNILNGNVQTIDLCNECFEASSPGAKEFSTKARDARCEYCGGQPCAGCSDIMAFVMGIEQMKFMCMPCSMEYNRYIQQELQQDSTKLPRQEQLTVLGKLREQADKHMKQWISRE